MSNADSVTGSLGSGDGNEISDILYIQESKNICDFKKHFTNSNSFQLKTIHASLHSDNESDNDKDNGGKFQFSGTVYLKNFKNQKSFDRCGEVAVASDEVDDVMQKLWNYCIQFLHRALLFLGAAADVEEISWDEDQPVFENRNNFMVFHDKSSKRNTLPTKVDGKTLQGWLNKEVWIVLYKFSDRVTTLAKWHAVESQLLRPLEKDRAGAESIVSINKLKDDLKATHCKYLCGDDVNWGCWASWISSQPQDKREELINQTPPQHLISLFSSVPVHSDTLLAKARLDLNVATKINNAYSRILNDLRADHEQLLNVASLMAGRISLLEEKQKEYGDMLSAMTRSVAVTENRYSAELAQSVTDCLDVDHK
ncbi:uncharacterized protein LOC134286641 [Aedes albopictus]|uniref:Uncharacterized protein n=1 Tax=Aedes albopictus TaxID=7160 RepID=A0ABM1XML2_AEDAL